MTSFKELGKVLFKVEILPKMGLGIEKSSKNYFAKNSEIYMKAF
jgi:hypothetical protein